MRISSKCYNIRKRKKKFFRILNFRKIKSSRDDIVSVLCSLDVNNIYNVIYKKVNFDLIKIIFKEVVDVIII